jgi:nucleoside-diphosphate-sugar epimerase
MQTNVGGTLALLAAAEQLGSHLQRFVFASSAAVYGPRSLYPEALVAETAAPAPPNLYGIWKLAGEHLARLFHGRSGVPTVCLRLNTTYGKGRDRGKTSAVTTAMKCAVRGSIARVAHPFRMPYQGRENYHFVEDVGAHFAAATLRPFRGFGAFNIKGTTIEVQEFLAIVQRVAVELDVGKHLDLDIAADATPNLFVSDLDDAAISRAFPTVPCTPIEDGIRRTLVEFKRLAASGLL